MYRYDPKKGLEPLPGLPLEASDREFDEALKEYEAQYGAGAGAAVKASGLYVHSSKDEPAKGGE